MDGLRNTETKGSQEQERLTQLERRSTTNAILGLMAGFLVILIFKLAQPVVLTILVAIVLAYIMDPVMMLIKRSLRTSVLLATLLTTIVFLGVFFGIGTIVTVNLVGFARTFPEYQQELLARVSTAVATIQDRLPVEMEFDPLQELRTLPVAPVLLRSARSVLSVGLQFLVVFFFAVLFLVEKYFFPRKLLRAFGSDRASKVPLMLRHIDASLRKYIGVKTLISMTVATLSTFALILFRVEFAVIWGVLTFLLNFIPSIGSITASLLPFVFSFAQYGGTAMPYWILLALTALQLSTGNVIEPMLMGDTLNLSLWMVFLSLLFWGWLWGPMGVLLAVPMTTSIRIVLRHIPATERYSYLFSKARVNQNRLLRRLNLSEGD